MTKTNLDAKKQHGVFSWNELMTTDVESAKSFYGSLFRWKLDAHPGDMPYTLASIDGQSVAGIMPMPPEASGMPANWGGFVTVDNVDESAKEAEKLGGKILLAPRDIPNLGRFCVIADPQGAPVSIITYLNQD